MPWSIRSMSLRFRAHRSACGWWVDAARGVRSLRAALLVVTAVPLVACDGQRAGQSVAEAGAGVTCVTALLTLLIGHLWLKIPMGFLTGMLGGLQTQPAVLGFPQEQSGNDLPNVGYATVYPVAFIDKIVKALAILLNTSGCKSLEISIDQMDTRQTINTQGGHQPFLPVQFSEGDGWPLKGQPDPHGAKIPVQVDHQIILLSL